MASETPVRTPLRRDVQGIRAYAVVAVVIFHAQHTWLPGGFVGVDMFFVISGFLITGLLRRDLAKTLEPQRNLTIRGVLSSFFVKRLRRLFPAAAIVVVATFVTLYKFGSLVPVHGYGWDAFSGLFYFANLRFSMATTGYFASADSPFLHLWSLSLEEQFYISLALCLALLVRRSSKATFAVLSVLFVASLTASIWHSMYQPTFAYYHLPTRGWEFLLGGLVAMTARYWKKLPWTAVRMIRAIALVIIVVSFVVINESMYFPGWVALVPTVGAALILAVGSSEDAPPRHAKSGDLTAFLLENRVCRYLGDISYSLYLWHWPMLVVPSIVLDRPLRLHETLAALGLSLLLGALSYHLVEQPIRFRRAGVPRVGRNLAAFAVASSLVVGLLAIGVHRADTRVELLSRAAATASIADGGNTGGPLGTERIEPAVTLNPALQDPHNDLGDKVREDCFVQFNESVVRVCEGGNLKSTYSVLIYGDSQAEMLWPAYLRIAQKMQFKLLMVTKGGCMPGEIPLAPHFDANLQKTCPVWRKTSLDKVRELKPNVIILAGLAAYIADGTGGKVTEGVSGYTPAYTTKWSKSVTQLIKSLPLESEKIYQTQRPELVNEPINCLGKNLSEPRKCGLPETRAVDAKFVASEAAAARAGGATPMSLNSAFCPDAFCAAIQSNYLVFLDRTHVTAPFMHAIAPQVWRLTTAALGHDFKAPPSKTAASNDAATVEVAPPTVRSSTATPRTNNPTD